jgi:calcineurin-like phosphoesterase family protein
MVDVWFTSDFHFGHANIIRYCDRPFSSVAEMDEAILDRLNSCVKTMDHLYFLGDFWSSADRWLRLPIGS